MGNKNGKKGANLTEFEIETIMANTNFTRSQIVQWHESFIRDCPNGKLSKKKFAEVYKTFYPNGKTEKYANQVFHVFDSDGNGEIDFEEFMIAMTMTGRQDAQSKLRLAFKIYDTDQNGRIDKKEMEKLIKAIYDLVGEDDVKGRNSPKERVKRIFGELDENHNGSLSADEFIQGLASDPELMKMLAPSAHN